MISLHAHRFRARVFVKLSPETDNKTMNSEDIEIISKHDYHTKQQPEC